MKTNNPIIDNMIDAQSNAMNTWMDSAKKFQSAFTNGTLASGAITTWLLGSTGLGSGGCGK